MAPRARDSGVSDQREAFEISSVEGRTKTRGEENPTTSKNSRGCTVSRWRTRDEPAQPVKRAGRMGI